MHPCLLLQADKRPHSEKPGASLQFCPGGTCDKNKMRVTVWRKKKKKRRGKIKNKKIKGFTFLLLETPAACEVGYVGAR